MAYIRIHPKENIAGKVCKMMSEQCSARCVQMLCLVFVFSLWYCIVLAIPWPPRDSRDLSDEQILFDARMKNAFADKDDAHICSAVPIPHAQGKEFDILEVIPHTNTSISHHMVATACDAPSSSQLNWHCSSMGSVCKGKSSPLYIWALNAQGITLPKDVGLRVGGKTGLMYIVIQMHYKNKFPMGMADVSGVTLRMTPKLQPYQAGIYLLSSSGHIPANSHHYPTDSACEWKEDDSIELFACRAHTHHLGRVVTGYRVRDGQWTEIGRIDPQKPQRFYNTSSRVGIRKGDILAARCVMDNSFNRTTYFGNDNWWQEMCDFYIMYKTARRDVLSLRNCVGNAQTFHLEEHFQQLPTQLNSFSGSPQNREAAGSQ